VKQEAESLVRATRTLLSLSNNEDVFLAPSVLVALRLLFHEMGVTSVRLSRFEYFDRFHFPRRGTTRTNEPPRRNSATIWSPVSWNGYLQRAPESNGYKVADASHIGAAGFQASWRDQADVIAFDLGKWIAPAASAPNVVAIVTRRPSLRAPAKRAFAGLHLSMVAVRSGRREARWVDPQSVLEMARIVRAQDLTPRALADRHQRNLLLAERIATAAGVSRPTSSILLLPPRAAASIPSWLHAQGCVWELPTGQFRVVCRADEQPISSVGARRASARTNAES